MALKILLDPQPESVQRFRREAQVLAQLSHPNLLRSVDLGEIEGKPYMALEFIQGRDLWQVLKTDGIPALDWTGRVLAATARALQHCHERGVVHRDLKPANVMIEAGTDRPVLADFGLLRRDSDAFSGLSLDDVARLTATGAVLGTPSYMAPEQIDRSFGEVGPASDVYALGATLYACLTGRPPFTGPAAYNVMVQVLRGDAPPDPRSINPQVPDAVAELCLRCMSPSPAERPASAEEFARLLEGTLDGTVSARDLRAPSTRKLVAIAALLVVVVSAVAVATSWPQTPSIAASDPAPTSDPLPSEVDPPQDDPARPPDPSGFTFLRDEAFVCGDQRYTVRVYRCEVFAAALGLAAGDSDVACEFVEIPRGEVAVLDSSGSRRRTKVPSLLVARTEVTQALWRAWKGQQPSAHAGERNPVEFILCTEALAFVQAFGVRLPSEAEWEYACRAGTTTPFGFVPDGSLYRYGRFKDNGKGKTHPVAERLPNALGLFDMHGNVFEWCEDTFQPNYTGAPSDGSAWVIPGATQRVVRGGYWNSTQMSCRSASRVGRAEATRDQTIGFRPVVSVP